MNADPNPIKHAITLDEHNFIVQTLNRNPLGADVSEAFSLINKLNTAAKTVVDKLNAEEAKRREAGEKALAAQAKLDAAREKAPKTRKTAVAAAVGTGGTGDGA